MLNRGGNRIFFAEAGRLPILARGRSIKNSVSDSHAKEMLAFKNYGASHN